MIFSDKPPRKKFALNGTEGDLVRTNTNYVKGQEENRQAVVFPEERFVTERPQKTPMLNTVGNNIITSNSATRTGSQGNVFLSSHIV